MPDPTPMIFSTVLFYLLALVLVVAAFRVITATSPVTGVLHLILTFFTASMIWMLLGAEFLSLLLVLVYVGAVMVLFLFVVMMLDVRMDELRSGLKTYLPLGLRSEEHTSELQSLMRISYAVFCLKKKQIRY